MRARRREEWSGGGRSPIDEEPSSGIGAQPEAPDVEGGAASLENYSSEARVEAESTEELDAGAQAPHLEVTLHGGSALLTACRRELALGLFDHSAERVAHQREVFLIMRNKSLGGLRLAVTRQVERAILTRN
jgi:hypothetical protein